MPASDLRPMSTGELLDRTFSLYRNHFWLFVGIMALPQLFALATGLSMEAVQSGMPGAAPGNGSEIGSPALITYAALFLVGMLIMVVAFYATYALALAATVFAVSEVHLGRPTSVRQAYAHVRGKVWRIIDVLFSTGLRIMGGFLLFVIPGILLTLRYALAIPSAMLEDLKAGAAMKRSGALTKGSYGRISLIFGLFVVVSWVAMFVFQFPFALAQGIYLARGEQVVWLATLSNLGGFVAGALAGPLMTIALSLLYYDQRVRKEAFDLQLMMAALDQKRAVPLSPPPSSP